MGTITINFDGPIEDGGTYTLKPVGSKSVKSVLEEAMPEDMEEVPPMKGPMA